MCRIDNEDYVQDQDNDDDDDIDDDDDEHYILRQEIDKRHTSVMGLYLKDIQSQLHNETNMKKNEDEVDRWLVVYLNENQHLRMCVKDWVYIMTFKGIAKMYMCGYMTIFNSKKCHHAPFASRVFQLVLRPMHIKKRL